MDNFEGSSSKYFRESFKGFNKDDVIQFVTKMIKEYSEAEENYKEEISLATENMLKKTQETTKLKKEIDALKADVQKKSNDAAAIQKKYTVLFEEYERQRTVIDALPGDVKVREELNKQINNLNAKLSEIESKLKNSESKLSDKIKELEQVKNKLNENEIKLNKNEVKLNKNEVKLIESEADKKFLLDVIKKFELETNVRVKDICDAQSLNDKKITFENNMIDMAKASKKIAALEEELSAIKKRNQELIEARSNADELSSDEEKIYEKITAELGNVIYSANRTAENIIAKATSEAEDIMNEVNIKRTMFLEEYERDVLKSKESFELLQNEYRTMAEKFKNSYETFYGELENVDQTLDGIHDKFSKYQNNSESN